MSPGGRRGVVRLAGRWICCVLAAAVFVGGCARESAVSRSGPVGTCCDADGWVEVPGDHPWVDSGVDVVAGQALTISAHGAVSVRRSQLASADVPHQVGPEGTFFFEDAVAEEDFPLPAGGRGPAPCYALIGRIGDGPPFFVGQRISLTAAGSGRLLLGTNDFDHSDNAGAFHVHISRRESVQPLRLEQPIHYVEAPAGPVPGAAVVVFYMDGLRPDVIREMAAMGHLPHIRRYFLEGGVWLQHAFTAFPSDTITSNGTMWTGCFSDRHGVKGQVRFSRRTLVSESYLEPLGPNRSARLLSPQGIDRVLHETQAASVRLVRGEEAGERWRQTHATDVEPLYARLRAQRQDWATGVLPVMTEMPPVLWTRSLVRDLPYLQAHQAWNYIDDANAHYAARHLLGRDSPVTIIWLPETDTVSHKQSRGQFGMTRRTIARADLLIGRVVRELELRHRLDRTYLMLVSDHGHHGGRTTHLAHFDLSTDVLYKPREITPDGRWVGGGWGLSVREHRWVNQHRGDSGSEFVFVDGYSDGVARIFLPRGHYRSRDWTSPARPAELFAYRIADHLPPLNLVESLTATTAFHSSGRLEHPVDLVLVKLSEDSILISTHDRGHAVVRRRRDPHGRWLYRYMPVADLHPQPDGNLGYRPVENPAVDPLELYRHAPARLLEYEHDERMWLYLTAESRYPDGVVALARHMLWQENLQYREQEFAPDLVVTARSGWYFGHQASPGTMHGYPFADSMTATWMICGPNIRRGARVVAPCRLVDLTPTILQIVGMEIPPDEVDGRPLTEIYVTESGRSDDAERRPLYWADVDLQAWAALEYTPLPASPDLPWSVNRPDSPLDLNNIAYNALSIGDWSPMRLADDALFPFTRGHGPLMRFVDRADERLRHVPFRPVGEGFEALDLTEVALADYSLSSLGNIKRIDNSVDWLQARALSIDRSVAGTLGQRRLTGTRLLHAGVDTAQSGFWELWRFTQRVIVQVLDETVLNGIEDNADRTINAFRAGPAEIVVEPHAAGAATR